MFRPFLLLALVAGALLPARAQNANPFDVAPFENAQRAMNEVRPLSNPFRALETLNGDAPFANLPFLRLRAGDQIVRGQLFSQPFLKGTPRPDASWSDPGVWLQRGDGAVQLSDSPQNGRLELSDASDISRFAWEPTRQNADALFDFWRQWQTDSMDAATPNATAPAPQSLTLAQLRQLDALLQPDYAEYESERLSQFLVDINAFKPGFQTQTGTGDEASFVYAGLGFNSTDGVYQYRWTLNNRGWNEARATLIFVPVPVSSSSQFQQSLPPNLRQSLPADARRRLDAQNVRLDKFYRIVKSALDAPPA